MHTCPVKARRFPFSQETPCFRILCSDSVADPIGEALLCLRAMTDAHVRRDDKGEATTTPRQVGVKPPKADHSAEEARDLLRQCAMDFATPCSHVNQSKLRTHMGLTMVSCMSAEE